MSECLKLLPTFFKNFKFKKIFPFSNGTYVAFGHEEQELILMAILKSLSGIILICYCVKCCERIDYLSSCTARAPHPQKWPH